MNWSGHTFTRRRRDWTDRRGQELINIINQGLELIMWEFTSKDCFSFYSEVDFDEVLFLRKGCSFTVRD